MGKMFDDLKQGLSEIDTYLSGKGAGFKVTVPAEIDVKSIRKKLHMTQSAFSGTFGFSLDAVKHWEGGRRTPEASTRAFLTVIARDPKAVISALHPDHSPRRMAARKRTSTRNDPEPRLA
jgi:putative transcriptional regulator